MKTLTLKHGLISLCLLLLAGCSVTPEPIIVTKTETLTLTPPAAYLQPTPLPEPSRPIDRNRDLSAHVEQLYMAIGVCNGDKRLTREWAAKRGGHHEPE